MKIREFYFSKLKVAFYQTLEEQSFMSLQHAINSFFRVIRTLKTVLSLIIL